MTQVLADPIQDDWRQFDLPHDRVAAPAQQAANAAGLVMVVDDEVSRRRLTQQASAVLHFAHLLDLLRREVVLPTKACSEVLLPCSFGVATAPLSQTLVSPLAVRLTVFAVAAARAVTALGPGQPPRRELGVGEVPAADTACSHASIMPCSTNTRPLDQPCHADVLLKLANGDD